MGEASTRCNSASSLTTFLPHKRSSAKRHDIAILPYSSAVRIPPDVLADVRMTAWPKGRVPNVAFFIMRIRR